jgi:hypothetical protein
MTIDRARFLLLTVSIAGGLGVAAGAACTVESSTSADAGPPKTDATTSDGSGGDGGGSDGAADGAGSEGGATDGSPGDDGGADGATGEGGPGCDDTMVDAGVTACGALGPDSGIDGGCGADPRAAGFCMAIQASLKPRPASAAVDCVSVSSFCESLGDCVGAALAGACPDNTAGAACDAVAAACADAGVPDAGTGLDGGDFASGCGQVMSGLTAAGRTKLATCYVGQSGCTDFTQCYAALGQ